ncbi:MAG: type II toxin-antitoxin system VapC family toxin [Acidobacteriota bacterium]
MNGEYLLDTNIIIAFLNGDKEISLKITEAEKIYTSVVVIGELLFGADNSRNPKENREKILEFIKFCEVLPIDIETSKMYAELKTVLKRKGRPIPENDIWIASNALQHQLIISTQDEHFLEIESLRIEKW